MGKPRRFNAYDNNVSELRKVNLSYGVQRQRRSVSSSFRGAPLKPPIATNLPTGGAGSGSSASTGTFISASLSADQTANLAANDHIEFDSVEAGTIVLQTGVGQADGIFELKQNKTYVLNAELRPEFSGATGQVVVAWYDITNAGELGKRAIYESQTHASNNANDPMTQYVFKPATDITVELRIISATALTAFANEYCFANIYELTTSSTATVTNDQWTGNVVTIASGAASQDIDVSAASWYVITLDKDMEITFTGKPASNDTVVQITLEYIQDSTGGWTVTYADSISPSDPTPVETANSREVITGFIRKTNAGTYVYNLYLVGN